MGFYLRKSIKVGPLRFNLSKSGVGVSAGIKGLRLGKGPRGNYVHMGRHGLYYRATIPSRSSPPPTSRSASPAPTSPPPPTADASVPIENADVAAMVDASATDLLAEINAKHKRWRILPWVLCLFAVAAIALGQNPQAGIAGEAIWAALVAGLIAGAWLAHGHDTLAKTTVLLFNIDDDASHLYQGVHDALNELAKCQGLWYIEARDSTDDWKHQAGAHTLIHRKAISVGVSPPRDVKTNIAVSSVPLGRQTLYFFPDRILVFSSSGAGAVSYRDLKIEVSSLRFIETQRVPSDANVVGQTWKYVNKSGGPDKRFKDNRQIPIALYDQMTLESASGLRAILQLSHVGVGQRLRAAVEALAQGAPSAS